MPPRRCPRCNTLVARGARCTNTRCPSNRARRHRATNAWTRTSRRLRQPGARCEICGSRTDLTVDHVSALVNGGGSDTRNLRVLCRRCNSSRADH